MKCFLCPDEVDPDDPTAWQATSCFSRSGRQRSGGSTGGADRVVYRYLDVFVHDRCVREFQRGTLGQEAMTV